MKDKRPCDHPECNLVFDLEDSLMEALTIAFEMAVCSWCNLILGTSCPKHEALTAEIKNKAEVLTAQVESIKATKH